MVVHSSDAKGVIIQQLEQWVRREVAFPEKSRGKCYKVVLKHLTVDRKVQGDVTQFPVKLEEGGEDEIEPLLGQVADAAQTDANDLNSGVQSYALCAYFTLDKNYVPRKIFRVTSVDEEVERDISPSEPPTDKGITSQLMRHNEAVMRQMTIMYSMHMQTTQRELHRLADMNERFAQQQLDVIALAQDMMDNSTKRRLDERREETNLAIKEEAMSKLAAVVPVVINRLAGQQVLPTEDRSFMLMASFLENLSDEQQQNFLATCTDAQRMVLAEILAEYEKKKSKLAGGVRQSPLGHRNTLPPPSSRDGKAPEPAPAPVLSALPLSERLTAAQDEPSDPVLKKIEADGSAMMSRFRDMFANPPKKGDSK